MIPYSAKGRFFAPRPNALYVILAFLLQESFAIHLFISIITDDFVPGLKGARSRSYLSTALQLKFFLNISYIILSHTRTERVSLLVMKNLNTS